MPADSTCAAEGLRHVPHEGRLTAQVTPLGRILQLRFGRPECSLHSHTATAVGFAVAGRRRTMQRLAAARLQSSRPAFRAFLGGFGRGKRLIGIGQESQQSPPSLPGRW
jgi:hypothetical protein